MTSPEQREKNRIRKAEWRKKNPEKNREINARCRANMSTEKVSRQRELTRLRVRRHREKNKS